MNPNPLRCAEWRCKRPAKYLQTTYGSSDRPLCGVHARSVKAYNPASLSDLLPETYSRLLALQVARDAQDDARAAERREAERVEEERREVERRAAAAAFDAIEWTWERVVEPDLWREGVEKVCYRVSAVGGASHRFLDIRIVREEGYPPRLDWAGGNGWTPKQAVAYAAAMAAAAEEAAR